MFEDTDAQPVSRNGFFYDGYSFYVEVDNHHHRRLDSEDLYSLLTYADPGLVLTKTGRVAKKQPRPHKDSPSHFYQAQCLHYGLKQYKQRPTAKKRLLDAFDPTTKTISVPARIMALEMVLRDEYDNASKIFEENARMKCDREEKEREVMQREKERRIEEQWEKRIGEAETFQKEVAAKGIIISREAIHGTDSDNEFPIRTVTDTEIRKDLAALSVKQLRDVVEKLVFDKKKPSNRSAVIKEIQAIKRAQAKPKAIPSTNKPGASLKSIAVVEENNPVSQNLYNKFQNKGHFHILVPYLQDNYDVQTEHMRFTMVPSIYHSHLWAQFHFGCVSGIMRSYGDVPKFVGDTVRFRWRGREEGEGETTYDKSNTGSITFLGDGYIKGRMRWMGTLFEFVGKQEPLRKNVIWSKYVDGWKKEYRGINGRSYERENIARWGKWGGDPDDDGPVTSNSDTETDKGESDDENENDDLGFWAGEDGDDCALSNRNRCRRIRDPLF